MCSVVQVISLSSLSLSYWAINIGCLPPCLPCLLACSCSSDTDISTLLLLVTLGHSCTFLGCVYLVKPKGLSYMAVHVRSVGRIVFCRENFITSHHVTLFDLTCPPHYIKSQQLLHHITSSQSTSEDKRRPSPCLYQPAREPGDRKLKRRTPFSKRGSIRYHKTRSRKGVAVGLQVSENWFPGRGRQEEGVGKVGRLMLLEWLRLMHSLPSFLSLLSARPLSLSTSPILSIHSSILSFSPSPSIYPFLPSIPSFL